jgi:hypothetical protein
VFVIGTLVYTTNTPFIKNILIDQKYSSVIVQNNNPKFNEKLNPLAFLREEPVFIKADCEFYAFDPTEGEELELTSLLEDYPDTDSIENKRSCSWSYNNIRDIFTDGNTAIRYRVGEPGPRVEMDFRSFGIDLVNLKALPASSMADSTEPTDYNSDTNMGYHFVNKDFAAQEFIQFDFNSGESRSLYTRDAYTLGRGASIYDMTAARINPNGDFIAAVNTYDTYSTPGRPDDFNNTLDKMIIFNKAGEVIEQMNATNPVWINNDTVVYQEWSFPVTNIYSFNTNTGEKKLITDQAGGGYDLEKIDETYVALIAEQSKKLNLETGELTNIDTELNFATETSNGGTIGIRKEKCVEPENYSESDNVLKCSDPMTPYPTTHYYNAIYYQSPDGEIKKLIDVEARDLSN